MNTRLLPAALFCGLLWLLPPRAAAQAGTEVPFITTPDHVTLAMLQLARVGPRDFVLDLGSGDGRIVITAARRFGARGLGVEIVPDLVARSRDNAARAGVSQRAEFREQDLFKTDLSVASVITMYLLPEVNLQLRPALLALKPGTRIVSHDWDLGDWPPEHTVTLEVPDKAVGREKLSRLHLWVVPARFEGTWCGRSGETLTLTQSHQRVEARHETRQGAGASQRWLAGRADGAQLALLDGAGTVWHLRHAGPRLDASSLAGASRRFMPAGEAGCGQAATRPRSRADAAPRGPS
ncbi:MAG: SAM-dependent methyltransferase [Betaproteobacteria bacterium]